MTTWAEIKTICQTLYPQYVGNGNLYDDSNGDSNTPSSLAILFDLTNSRIANYPFEFEFLKVPSTITLTGASSYNLKTLFPDLKSVYQLYGVNPNQEETYQANYESNITDETGYTMKDDTLVFAGTLPVSGTANIQYKSKYMVKNAAGTRKRYFLEDDDETVLDNPNALIFGIGQYINWGTDSFSQDRRRETMEWYKEEFNNLILHNKQTHQNTMRI